MRPPRSIQTRLALAIGLGVTLIWIAAATVTATILRHEMDEVFDSALQETAQRLLPLAVLDIVERDEQDERSAQQLAMLRQHEEHFTYVVRDAQDRVLIKSHAAVESVFPPFDGIGFRSTPTHRLYSESALRDTVTITVAEPLAQRAKVAREMQLGLGLPLLLVIPLSLATILGAVRLSFRPVRRLRDELATRGAQDLSPVRGADLPSEIGPIARAVNQLLGRLEAAFEAERSFASNAAHELRTPVAGAIAQAQRLRTETTDPKARTRAADIEATLKRLIRLSEKLTQLARAEGGRLRTGRLADLRPILELVAADFDRSAGAGRLVLTLPVEPVRSDIDPDAFGILSRNLIENAVKYGDPDTPVEILLSTGGLLSVSNDGPVVSPETLKTLTARFERGTASGDGSGLGLAIAQTIVDRADGSLTLHSPRLGHETGFNAVARLPIAHPGGDGPSQLGPIC